MKSRSAIRKIELHAPDLRRISLENALLNGANLRFANLSGVCLRGAHLREAILDHVNLSGADLTYTDLSGASLREADLRGTVLYPAETIGAKFYGAKFSTNDDAAEYARIALEEICRRVRIRPNSVAFRKLQRINGFPEFFIPAQAEMCHVSTWAEEPSHGSRIARVHGG
jgi:uncharacterized protein YjbI with pentapeptide repeats